MFGLQLDHVALTVKDPEATADWYERVLGLARATDIPWERYPIVMRAGATAIALSPSGQQAASTGDRTLRHVAFRTDRRQFRAIVAALGDAGIALEREHHGTCESVYLTDPDGTEIEITTYDMD